MAALFLNIGCGAHKLPGFVNIDRESGADLELDVTLGLPFADGAVQGIFSEHFIGHLTRPQAIAFLRECRRVLCPGGVLRVATPDLEQTVGDYQGDWRSRPWLAQFGYEWIGTRCEMLNIAFREWGHQWLYDEEELVRVAELAGLAVKRRWPVGMSDVPQFQHVEYRAESMVLEFVRPGGPRAVAPASQPLVSVLIPAYNHHYFEECLASAIAQTYRTLEILIGDDCPSDEIASIVRKFEHDPRVRYHRNRPALGSFQNYLHLFARARGEYVKFLNDDDVLHPECIERMVRCMEEHPEVTLVTSYRQLIDADGRRLPPTMETAHLLFEDAHVSGQALGDFLLCTRINRLGEPTTTLFRKRDLQHVQPPLFSLGGQPIHWNGDVVMWLNLLSRGDAIYLSDTLSYFRRHAEQESAHPQARERALRAWDEIFLHGQRLGFLVDGRMAPLHFRPLRRGGPALAANQDGSAPPPLVSIIIPTFNKWEYTSACLESLHLAAQTQQTSCEVIIVDNASTDLTSEALGSLPGCLQLSIRIHRNKTNLGFAKACNQGARLARGRYLLFLNNDTEARPGWLDAMVETIESDPSIAIVGSKLLYPDGTIQHGGVIVRRGRPYPIIPAHLHRGRPAGESDQPLDLNAVTAACLLIRREIFAAAGGFDEGYVNGYEDVDLCFKVKEQGWRIVYTPKSVLVHHESVSSGRHQRDIENLNRLHWRWLGRFTAFDEEPGSPAAGALEALPDSPRPGVAVVVQIGRSLATIASCLDRLLCYTGRQDEILCVQCGPADASLRYAELLAGEHPERMRVLWAEEDAAATPWPALRRAVGAATHEYVALIEADVAATPGWLDRLVACLEAEPDAGAVGPLSNGVGLQDVGLHLDTLDYRQHGIYQIVRGAFQDVGLHLDTLDWLATGEGGLDSAAARLAALNAGRYLEASRLLACCLLARRAVLRDVLESLDPIALSEEPDAAWSEAFRRRGHRLLIATDALVGQAVEAATPGGRRSRLELPDGLVQSYLQDYALALLSQIRAAPCDGLAMPAAHEDQACLAQAEALRRQGGLDGLQQAYDYLSACLVQRPESMGLRLALADLLLEAGEAAASFGVLAEGITDPPQHAGLYLRLAIAALLLGRADDARNAFEIALALAPEALAPTGFLTKAFASALDLARRAALAA